VGASLPQLKLIPNSFEFSTFASQPSPSPKFSFCLYLRLEFPGDHFLLITPPVRNLNSPGRALRLFLFNFRPWKIYTIGKGIPDEEGERKKEKQGSVINQRRKGRVLNARLGFMCAKFLGLPETGSLSLSLSLSWLAGMVKGGKLVLGFYLAEFEKMRGIGCEENLDDMAPVLGLLEAEKRTGGAE